MNVKDVEYSALIEKFKKITYENTGLKNPFDIPLEIKPESEHLNPWAHWHGNLDARIVFIGQDWGDQDYFEANRGRDSDTKSPTNNSLQELFGLLGYDIGTPQKSQNLPLYFTNAVLGIKSNGMSSPIKTSWYSETTDPFLKPLIETVIQPEVVITMGSAAYDAISRIYPIPKLSFKDAIERVGFDLPGKRKLFVVGHCSPRGKSNRPFDKQLNDWKKINEYLLNHKK